METPNRCPYCLEGEDFKVMKERLGGAWLECENCGHVAMPNDPEFHCCCRNCTDREPSTRRRELQ